MCNKWSIRAWCRTGTLPYGKGDIGFVFPDIIHHYQVLTPGVNTAIYLIASPFVISKFADIMQSMAPEYPIIRAEKVEQEVYRVINAILETEQPDITVAQAYLQIVLARCMGKLNLVEKSNVGSRDLIYQAVSYISANFKKKVFAGRDGKRSGGKQICLI